jgi:hypothetical protein
VSEMESRQIALTKCRPFEASNATGRTLDAAESLSISTLCKTVEIFSNVTWG